MPRTHADIIQLIEDLLPECPGYTSEKPADGQVHDWLIWTGKREFQRSILARLTDSPQEDAGGFTYQKLNL